MYKTTTHHGTEKHVDEETWVLVDLDNCLFQAPQGVAHTHYFEHLMKEAMKQGQTREEAFRKHYPTWVKAQETTHMIPLEESFIPYIQELQKKGITVMAITHRHPCTLDITKRQLNELSCHFSKRAPSKDSFALQYEDPAYYTDGILFVHDLNDKGEVFLSFCDKINKLPKKVLLYDDKLHNLESLQKALSTKEIPFTGIHYVAIDLKAPPLQEVTL